jgi:hypothetical protein
VDERWSEAPALCDHAAASYMHFIPYRSNLVSNRALKVPYRVRRRGKVGQDKVHSDVSSKQVCEVGE